MKKRVKFITLGCKVNQYETNAMAQKFIENGYELLNENQSKDDIQSDICIINTCTVTNISDRKSRKILRKMKELNPNTYIVAVRVLCSSCKRRNTKNARNRFSFGK